MSKVFWQDRIVSDAKEVKLDAFSSATFYGKSVFTTVAIREGQPLLRDKHWQRLDSNAEILGVDISAFSKDHVFTSLAELVKANALRNGVGRITFFDLTSGNLWTAFEKDKRSALLITTRENRNIKSVFNLAISPFLVNSTSPLAGIKSGNYLENLLALQEARERGFDEAVRINERGEIVSGCMSNIFWQSENRLYTPALSTGCLPGTTRASLIEKYDCDEVVADISDLSNADGIFMTSAGIGIVQASRFNGKQFSVREDEITSLIF